jgi:hypothetical protein
MTNGGVMLLVRIMAVLEEWDYQCSISSSPYDMLHSAIIMSYYDVASIPGI